MRIAVSLRLVDACPLVRRFKFLQCPVDQEAFEVGRVRQCLVERFCPRPKILEPIQLQQPL